MALSLKQKLFDYFAQRHINLMTPEIRARFDEYDKNEILSNQLESFGFYLSEHPTNTYREKNDIETKNISTYFDKNINLILLIDNIKEVTTKKNDIMAFITASDEFGQVSLTMFPKIYQQFNNINKKNIIRVFGHVEKRYDKYQIIVNNLKIIKDT